MEKILNSCLEAGIKASKEIIDIYNLDFEVNFKEDKSPVTIADISSSRIIETVLAKNSLPIISEENSIPDYSERKNYSSYFLIDPLDGTKEFINKTGEFCVNIAYVENSIPVLGFIFDPINKVVVYGGESIQDVVCANYCEESYEVNSPKSIELVETKHHDTIRLITSRRANFNKLHEHASNLYESKKIETLTKGSALKFIDLALDKADVYPRFGNTMEWDIAPGFAILNQLNGSIVEMNTGNDMKFNKENLLNSHFIAYNRKIYE